jgi:hypothetical protein
MAIRIANRCWTLFSIIAYAGISSAYIAALPDDEVVLTIGESYDQVLQRSHSTLPIGEPGFWGGFVKRPAKLRFTDPRYGFDTPAAKFFFVSVDRERKVSSVKLSPQVKTLPLDAAMDIIVDLQNQFRQSGWTSFRSELRRPIEDTPAMRAQIRRCADPTSVWQAEDKYQVMLDIRCFRHENRPNDERYLITLDLGPPIFKDYGGKDNETDDAPATDHPASLKPPPPAHPPPPPRAPDAPHP